MFPWLCRLFSAIILFLLFLAVFFFSGSAAIKEALLYLSLALFVLSFLWPIPAISTS